MTDVQTDDMFDNRATGSGLDPYEDTCVLFVPTAFIKDGGKSLRDQSPIDVADTIVVGFAPGEDPDESTVRVHSGALVSTLRRAAVFNEAVEKGTKDPQDNGLPKMVIGRLYKDIKNQKKGQATAWALDKVEDEAVISSMRSYALKNFKESSPFES